uniref:Osteoclast-stimulating factor 1 n=1 Tax=Clastoptera arizonana TaxID=38151 RepID=A0A1B6D484_9HEMI
MSVIPPKPKPKPGQVAVFRALYNYTAQQNDELSFVEGDLLYVFDQTTDPLWWKARCGDKTGVIPSNYVQCQAESVENPLHDAARRGNLSYLLESLQQGVSATGLDAVGNTALYWACRGGHLDCVNTLLSLPNPPVNAQNKIGDTALHAAAAHDHIGVIKLLLDKGADMTVQNNDGETPLECGSSAVTSLLRLCQTPNSKPSTYSAEDYFDESD